MSRTRVPTIRPLRLTARTWPRVQPSGSGTACAVVPVQYTGRVLLVPTASSPVPMSYTVPLVGAWPAGRASRVRISGVQAGAPAAPAGPAAVISPASATAAAAAAVLFLMRRLPLVIMT